VFDNRVLKRKLGPKREEVMEAGEDYIMRNFVTWSTSPNIIRVIKSSRMRWMGM
jgi:hypothetical protein